VTLKTFLPADVDIAGLKVAAYLTRLAAEATTIINAADYGRQVYDLAIRRDLIAIGEDMVNVAFDAPVDVAPREQIEDAERWLYDLAEIGKTAAASRNSRPRSPPPSTWPRAPINATASSPGSPPGSETSTARWADCSPPI
jgi:replicative DNA helicase